MKKAEILKILMDKFPSIRKDGLEHLAMSLLPLCTSQERTEELVGELTAESVGEIVRDWRKSVDVETSKAIDTFKKSLPRPEPSQDPNKDEPKEPKQPEPKPDISAETIAKLVSEAVAAQLKPYQDEVNRMKGKEVQNNRQALLESALKDTPDYYSSVVIDGFRSKTFDNDEAFDVYLNETKEKANAVRQDMADKGLKVFGGGPVNPKRDAEKVSPAVTAYIESEKQNGGLGGKQI